MLKLGWDLVWTIINLIVLYLLMKKFLIGPVMGIMEKRKALIADQLDHAKVTNEQAEALKGQYEQALSSAREESVQIIRDEIAGLAMEAAKKLLVSGSSETGNQMLYDEFLAKAGDANDTDRH